jgi:uncharacterized protein (TIGR03086 family)
MDLLESLDAGLDHVTLVSAGIADRQWGDPTPDTEWDVRTLFNHVVGEQLWVPPLLAGKTLREVGDRFDGDVLGADPVRRWHEAAAGSREAFSAPGALERTVHTGGGIIPAEAYGWQMVLELTVHGWDLARGVGYDDRMPPGLAETVYARVAPQLEGWNGIPGTYAPPVAVGSGADAQAKLLALLGRDPA